MRLILGNLGKVRGASIPCFNKQSMVLISHTFRTRPQSLSSSFPPQSQSQTQSLSQTRAFSSTPFKNRDLDIPPPPKQKSEADKKAKALNRKGLDEYEAEVREDSKRGGEGEGNNEGKWDEDELKEVKEKQVRSPWMREGSDLKPVRRSRSAGAMTKGKLLTTPSRLLKLILPLTTLDHNTNRKNIEPLALLVHPQQPLSYLERLIQSEIPMIKDQKDGSDKVPSVWFRAEESGSEESEEGKEEDLDEAEEEDEGEETIKVDGKNIKVGKIKKAEIEDEDKPEIKKSDIQSKLRGGPGEGGVESYSGQGRESSTPSPQDQKFVRWSSSTEIGDFIRDAARGKEFAVEIEGKEEEIRVGVPSFNDRTHFLRVRLRKTSRKIAGMADLKEECDSAAHRSAQRLAMGGFAVLGCWWAGVYFLTFWTDYGWDTMEPITYLAGLSTIMTGYLWFLYHNREVSYRAALNLTVSRRQNTLYQDKGFDMRKWELLIEEANSLRKEIKQVADEYDVEWDEKKDEGSERVHDALKKERDKKGKKGDEDEDDGGDEGGGSGSGKEKEKDKKGD